MTYKEKDELYDKWSQELGRELKVSKRVIRHIRSFAYAKHDEGDSYEFIKDALIKNAEDKLSELKKHVFLAQVRYGYILFHYPTNLGATSKMIQRLTDNQKQLFGFLDKTGYYSSVLSYVKQRMDEEGYNRIVTDEVVQQSPLV